MSEAKGKPSADRPAGKRILIVDDEEALLISMARFFHGLGCFVVTASEREEAQALLEHDRFDLVMLDLALTGLGLEGLEVLAELKRSARNTPVLVLSGLVTPELEEELVRRGASAVLQKPQAMLHVAEVAMGLMVPRR